VSLAFASASKTPEVILFFAMNTSRPLPMESDSMEVEVAGKSAGNAAQPVLISTRPQTGRNG